MRSTLLVGVAVCAFTVAAPSISFVDFPPSSGRGDEPGAALFDPLAYLGSICRTRPGGPPPLLARFLSAATADAATSEQTDAPPPLILGAASGVMGATVNDAARPYFQQGMGLVDGFNHMEGVRAFRAAQALDPDCAMCFWGEAYALGCARAEHQGDGPGGQCARHRRGKARAREGGGRERGARRGARRPRRCGGRGGGAGALRAGVAGSAPPTLARL